MYQRPKCPCWIDVPATQMSLFNWCTSDPNVPVRTFCKRWGFLILNLTFSSFQKIWSIISVVTWFANLILCALLYFWKVFAIILVVKLLWVTYFLRFHIQVLRNIHEIITHNICKFNTMKYSVFCSNHIICLSSSLY